MAESIPYVCTDFTFNTPAGIVYPAGNGLVKRRFIVFN